MNVNNGLHVFEVFEKIQEAKTKKDKVAILKENNHWAVRDIIKGTMSAKIKWLLPEGKPPYRANRPESSPSNLLRKNQDFGYFMKGGKGGDLSSVKRESIFIGLLEAVHPKDAELVVNMIAKKPIKGITKKIVDEAYPGLL